MPKKNPRPDFIQEMVSVCRVLDRRLVEVEAMAEGLPALAASGRAGVGAPATWALVEEMKGLKMEASAMNDYVVGEREKLGQFLQEMKGQMGEIFSSTRAMEEFMAQYGWQDRNPVTEESLDWSTPPPPEEAPPSEAEAPLVGDSASPLPGSGEPSTAGALPPGAGTHRSDSPSSIFDLGLSDATLRMLVSQAKPKGPSAPPTTVAPPSRSPRLTSHLSTGTLEAGRRVLARSPLRSPALPQLHSSSASVLEDTLGGSPLLLRSKLSSLPPMPDTSLSHSFAQGLEISPGLPRRVTPEPREDTTTLARQEVEETLKAPPYLHPRALRPPLDSPSPPHLQTMDIRKLVASTKDTARTLTPEEPTLQTIDLRNLVTRVQTAGAATPEEPVLASLPHQGSTRTGARTPEVPLARPRIVTESPETPVLQTMVLRKLH